MTSTIDLIQISGTVLDAPALTSDDLVEFVVADDLTRREYLVRLPRTALAADVTLDAHVRVAGAAGWVVPGRVWRHEPSRTILQANDVQLAEFAFAA